MLYLTTPRGDRTSSFKTPVEDPCMLSYIEFNLPLKDERLR